MWNRGLYGTAGTAQAFGCFCHLLPLFSTSVLIMFGSQDVPPRFVFMHLEMSISISSSLVVTEVSPTAYHRLLCTHLSFLFLVLFLQDSGFFIVFCVSLLYVSVERIFLSILYEEIDTQYKKQSSGCTPLAI